MILSEPTVGIEPTLTTYQVVVLTITTMKAFPPTTPTTRIVTLPLLRNYLQLQGDLKLIVFRLILLESDHRISYYNNYVYYPLIR